MKDRFSARDRYDMMIRDRDYQSHGATYRQVHGFDKAMRRLNWPWLFVRAGNWLESHVPEIVVTACLVGALFLLYLIARWPE